MERVSVIWVPLSQQHQNDRENGSAPDGVADLIEQPELIFLPGVHHASIILEENYLWYDYQWYINILDAKKS